LIITFVKSGGGIGLDELGAKNKKVLQIRKEVKKKGRKRLLFVDLSPTK